MRPTAFGPLLLTACLAAGDAAPELPPVVYIPSGDHAATIDPAGKGVWLPYDRFRQWWERANPNAEPPPAPPLNAALTELALDGRLEGARARFAVKLTAVAVAPGWSTVELPGDLPLTRFVPADPRVVVQRARAVPVVLRPGDTLIAIAKARLGDGERWKAIAEANPGLDPAKLPVGACIQVPLPEERTLVHLPAPGTYAIDAEVAAAVSGEAGAPRSLDLPLPAAGAVRAELVLPGAEPAVELASDGAWSSKREGEATRILVAARGDRLRLRWRPAVAATGEAVLSADSALTVHVAPRALRYELAATVTVARRPVERIRLAVPAGVQVLAVEGPAVARWEPADGGVDAVLAQPSEGEVKLSARLERVIDAAAATRLELAWPHIAGTSRATGSVALLAHDGVRAGVAAAPGLARIDPAELGVEDATAAFRYYAEPAPAALDLAVLAPELRVQAATLVRLGAEETTVTARFHLEVRQAGTFALAVTAPEGWDLLDTAGPVVDEIRPQTPAGGMRRFGLQLRSALLGEGDLTCRFRAPPGLGAGGFALAAPRLEGVRAARGAVAVAAPAAWALQAADRAGLAGLDPAEAGRQPLMAELTRELARGEEVALAFTWQSAAAEAPHARLVASPRPRELSATVEERITVKDGQVARTAAIHGEVRYNPAAALTLVLPSALDELAVIRGDGLSERVRAGSDPAAGTTTWELRFQPPLLGAFQLAVEAAAPAPRLAPGHPETIAVAPLRLPDVARLTYVAAVARDGAIDLAAAAPGLDPVAPADLPAAIGRGAVAGFQGHQGAELRLTATRQDLLALADAGIARAAWRAVIGEDGVVRLRGRLEVMSRGRAQLALALPDGATLVEAAVDGRAARASRREDGAAVLAMPADGGGHRLALVVESRSAAAAPGAVGRIAIELPRVAPTTGAPPVPVARSEVELWLPRRWLVTGWSGDLAPEGGVGATLDLEGEDGLSVPVAAAGIPRVAARVGDGGRLEVGIIGERAQQVLAVLAAAAALAGLWFLARRPIAALASLAILAAAWLLAVEAWTTVAAAALVGGGAGAILAWAAAAVAAWRARRAARKAVDPDPWIEGSKS